MLFFFFNNENIEFSNKKLIWKFYGTIEALFTTYWIEFIDITEFTKVALDANFEIFVIYI